MTVGCIFKPCATRTHQPDSHSDNVSPRRSLLSWSLCSHLMHHEYLFCFGDEWSHDRASSRAVQHQMTYPSFLQNANLGHRNNLIHTDILDFRCFLDVARLCPSSQDFFMFGCVRRLSLLVSCGCGTCSLSRARHVLDIRVS